MRDSTAFESWERVSWIFFRSMLSGGGACVGVGVLSCASISLMTGWAMKFMRIGLIVASLYLGDVKMMLLRRCSKA